MKAVRLHKHGGPEVLVYEDVPDPEPGPGQILIRVEAVGVNFADTMRRQNSPLYPYPSPPPFTPGGEVAGVVERIGSGVQSPEVGTRVFAFVGVGGSTGYAQFAVADASQAIPIPAGLDAVRACTLLVAGLTAVLTIQESAQLQAGESVLVQAAAGGVGTYAVQLAKLLGAGTVIGAASTPEKRDLARRLGADHVVDYTRDGWSEEVRAITGGRGVDVVLEMIGGSVFRQSLDCLAPFGRCVVYGLAGPEPGSLQPTELLALNQSLVGFYLGIWFEHRPEKAVAALQLLIGHVLTGRIEVQIGRVLPLAQAAEAHRLLEGRATMGKLVLEPWAEG
jgi:NADPH:quinone reductase